ncbi:transporter substrate-binding domain-containing protein [Pseudochrobactrum lubricantis]|uniref:transporter substrate-binding domain-containing protein n=1 Tax=Pseudochrobactrum lubricantis TaxID=558172 RepID=UPI0035DFB84C|nr:transporter substrate-binding domain-containing protein [Ochrobactrum sp. MR28]MBX8818525.1 transporter substrate-binding domain-containing protein [Ochrobactrum sp. MR31]
MKTKAFATALVLLVAPLLSGVAQAKEWKTVNVGVEGAFPPFNSTKANGELVGLDLDVMKEVCKRAKLECNISAQDWDSLTPSLVAGKFDIMLTAGPTEERRKVIDFTNPYVITPNTFLVASDSPLVNLPHTGKVYSVDSDEGKKAVAELKEALKGKTLGAALSTSQLKFAENEFGEDSEVRTYKSAEQSLLDLTNGRIDAQFDNLIFATDRSKASGGRLQPSGPHLLGGIMATSTTFGIRKDEPELKAILNEALDSMQKDGTLSKISEEWFLMDLSPKQ